MTGRLLVGTSGWHYDSWIGPFYPAGRRKADLLAFYAGRFGATEINLSHYRLPSEAALATWRVTTPEAFVFAWKAHRIITHYRRLRGTDENVRFVFDRMEGLGAKAGPVLFQLPPRQMLDLERLAAFLDHLPAGRRYTFEFRHPGWYEPATLQLLADRGVALCLSDHAHAPAPWVATAPFVYIRGHGPSGRYHGSYPDDTLAEWAQRSRAWLAAGRDVFAFFDNDIKAAAPADAERFLAFMNAG